MPNCHVSLPFLFLLFLLLHSTAAVDLDLTDLSAMQDLSTSISAATSLGWNPTTSPCTWTHVTCNGARVSSIQIGNQNLSGRLPPSISNLTSLSRLEVQFNSLSGPLPSLKGFSLLQTLLLHNNRFSSIPHDFFSGMTSLQSVSLDNNPFDPWDVPETLKDATTLVNFSANGANVTGGLALFSGENFPSLTHLRLSYNLLRGSLPVLLGSSTLTSFWVNNQRMMDDGVLSGNLDVIGNMTYLTQVWLHSNNFSGPLPDFTKLVNLEDLNLRDNRITGPVPSSLAGLKSLKSVILTNNLLQGPLPVFGKAVVVDLKVDSESFCLPSPGECDPRVSALLSVVKDFGYPLKFADGWKGNEPCSGGTGGSWLGIGCDNGGNVTVINFRNMGLTGKISSDFVMFPNLQKLILSGNNITGVIPDSLTSLRNLNELDVSNNSLFGKVPTFKENVLIITSGNPGIGNDSGGGSSKPGSQSTSTDGSSSTNGSGDQNGSSAKSSSSKVGAIVGSAIGGGVAVICVVGLMVFCLHKSKSKSSGRVQSPTVIRPGLSGSDRDLVKVTVAGSSVNGGTGSLSETFSPTSSASSNVHVVESGNMVISIQVLRNVTNNFSDESILGQGGFGTVYKGELHDGTKIAVKRMEAGVMGTKGLTEFQSEIAVLTKVRHRNLVSLLGYCLDGNERLLVYEYMPQGTLSRYLFNWKEECLKPLEWKKRLAIALDVARGVEYLHTLAHQSFIHRDLKPSNILLGDDLKAKVADFGLVRLAPDGKCSIETRLAGTFGYLAPEYAVTGRVTTKADVFSFGVILMELITGRKALDESQPEECVHLVTWFKRMQLNMESFSKAIDPPIELDEETFASVSTVSELAGHCCAREPYQRPDMGHAVNVLSSLAEVWRPSDPESEDSYGIDFDMTLPQALKKWQEFEDNGRSDATSSSFLASVENTQTSIPTRPSGFADSFTSADGR